uniref:NADH dehydrogenase subunit 2 n=1 Tax=Brueelia antiqua TaxID=580326 RepID=UPI00211F4591|nr:NADH dehydrogenase subunit 2 [Brueelia antiqua]UTT72552.1 NADH dehydrogenase subunit 2 [Brueelia antiqua]
MKIASINLLISLNLMGSFMILSSPSWFSVWVGIELSSMTAPPLMISLNSSLVSKINSWKYYMVQCYSSAIFFLCMLSLSSSSTLSSYSNIIWMIIIFSMLFKMGILPFHGWFFHIALSLPWVLFLVLSTIQKIGPLLVISECSKAMSYLFQPDLLISSIIALISISSLNINSIRYFMITSSIINSAWMLASTQVGKFPFFSFMVIYFIHLLVLFSFLSKEFNNPLESSFVLSKSPFFSEFAKTLIILSMIGMPPMVGFFMKMSIIEQLIPSHLATATILTLSSSIIMLMYMKMIISAISNMRTESVKQNKSIFHLSLALVFFTLSSTYITI